MSTKKIHNIISFIIVIIMSSLLILWGIKISLTNYEKIKDYSVMCSLYMVSDGEEIKRKIFTNDEWTKKSSLTSYDGKVYNLDKFHYYECKYLRRIDEKDHFIDRDIHD